MRKRLWDLAKSRIEIATILPGHRHKVTQVGCVCAPVPRGKGAGGRRSESSHVRSAPAHHRPGAVEIKKVGASRPAGASAKARAFAMT